ncbi:hypothetical protein BRC95_01745 [Halobacteriales archaeon QS_5_68_33]|nr:MAG: hypothetical protein BRC95_01745 [Halobacteriales archaeon QS_5_68_33]
MSGPAGRRSRRGPPPSGRPPRWRTRRFPGRACRVRPATPVRASQRRFRRPRPVPRPPPRVRRPPPSVRRCLPPR